jgi:Fic family protein
MSVRVRGDWEGWLRFFLRGIVQTAQEASDTGEQLFELREDHRGRIIELDTTFPTAGRVVSGLEDLGILVEITGRRRSRMYRYEPYVALFDDPPQAAIGP